MDKCPKCHKFTVAYDSYRKVTRCMVDGCSCIVIDKETYSHLKANLTSGTVDRVKVKNGSEKGIVRRYKIQVA